MKDGGNMLKSNDFPVTDRTLATIKKVMDKQDDYGLRKYGKALDSKENYSWLCMALEELADGLKYIQCEIERKSYVIQILQSGLRANEPKEFIEVALQLLTVEGTGK